MPTVNIRVSTYKKLVGSMYNLFNAIDPEAGIDRMFELYQDLPFPDWVCNHCGYENAGDFEGKPCPRCNKNPVE